MSRWRAVLLVLAALIAVSHGARARADQAQPMAAIACDRLHTALRFPLLEGVPQQPQTADAFDMRRTDVALTCQVVVIDANAGDPGEAVLLLPGSVGIAITGPASIIETGSQSVEIDCGAASGGR